MMPEQNDESAELIRSYQMVQEQLRGNAMQIEQLQIQKGELDSAKQEVEKGSGRVYVSIGGVMTEATKESALKDIAEKRELSGVRLQAVNKQYAELRAKEKELRDKITKMSKP